MEIGEPKKKESHCVKQWLVMTSSVNDKPNAFNARMLIAFLALSLQTSRILLYFHANHFIIASRSFVPCDRRGKGIHGSITTNAPWHLSYLFRHNIFIFAVSAGFCFDFSAECPLPPGLHCCVAIFFHSIRFTFYKYIESDKKKRSDGEKSERNHS